MLNLYYLFINKTLKDELILEKHVLSGTDWFRKHGFK